MQGQSSSTSRVELAPGLSREFLLHHRVCPSAIDISGALVVSVAQGLRAEALIDLEDLYRRRVVTEEVATADLERIIERLVGSADHFAESESTGATDADLGTDVREIANQPPVIRYVNMLIRDAFDAGASDIHLEAQRIGGLSVRFRLDGVLVTADAPPPAHAEAVVSRIKLLAELDTADRRRPQDGRIRVRLETRDLDLRVSTVPTLFGESVVIRLLDQGGRPAKLTDLGLVVDDLRAFEALVSRPHGLVIVTGPTGSGKTTTLYGALSRRDTGGEKIVTVEDPVEYELPGIAQVPVHRQAGVTMGSALRSILRQDPDVIMVGEMRDSETAEIAIQAAMTGHLVLSTLHTTDAIGAVPRLLDLGIPAYLVAATLDGILAQRLVRRICEACRVHYRPDPAELRKLSGLGDSPTDLTRGAGCSSCRGTGFRGRLGLFELLVVNDEIKEAITRGAGRADLDRLAIRARMRPLRIDGWEKVLAGDTTVEEVLRVSSD
ncbi:MAG: GspE/PulE family protein [Gemmatimonadales bacterium]|nr:GspE/PulE family protein [Gemmatimonadales bacterium]